MSGSGQQRGRLVVIGTGPGSREWMSPEVVALVGAATDLVGYGPYLDLLGPLAEGKVRHASDNRQEIDRVGQALELAAAGRTVALVSSGDPGIFGMAAAVFEVLDRDPQWRQIEVTIAPGISAMLAAAARIGAPLGHDFCVISLSDNLKPWSVVEQRIAAAASADFVVAIYNPASSQRGWQLDRAKELLLAARRPETPVILARNVGRDGEAIRVITLGDLTVKQVDMRTLVIVGSSQTRIVPRDDGGCWVYTPRRYPAPNY
jgi:cobalt-precorrin 5A hydrolase / cobalt-factor III methyltransferase / precorrin-3B C17-methyltransferase